jgi:two-component system, LytTR family, response regulator
MKVLLIDDERLARQEMRRLLAEHPDVDILAEAANAAEAAEKIAALQPDLLLLDVSMPAASGFDLLAGLDSTPRVIFVTAFDHYALKAFEVNALDYLVKPVQAARLAAALDKIRQEMGKDTALLAAQAAPDRLGAERQVFLKDGEKCYFVRLGEVWLIESVGNYARLHFGAQHALLHRSLQHLENRLDPMLFFRANRQEMVNVQFIQKVEPLFKGNLRITLKSGRDVEASTRQAAIFRERMSL